VITPRARAGSCRRELGRKTLESTEVQRRSTDALCGCRPFRAGRCQLVNRQNRLLVLWALTERAGSERVVVAMMFELVPTRTAKEPMVFAGLSTQELHPTPQQSALARSKLLLDACQFWQRENNGLCARCGAPDAPKHRWGLVPDAQNRALRVITFDDRETVHNAFFGWGFLKARTRSQPSTPADHPHAPASLKERREGFRFLERRPNPSGPGPPPPAFRPCHATSWRPLPMAWCPLRNGSG
jgi:hypothetical protein